MEGKSEAMKDLEKLIDQNVIDYSVDKSGGGDSDNWSLWWRRKFCRWTNIKNEDIVRGTHISH